MNPVHLYLTKPSAPELTAEVRITRSLGIFQALGATGCRPAGSYTAGARVVDGTVGPHGIFDLGCHERTKYRVTRLYSAEVSILTTGSAENLRRIRDCDHVIRLLAEAQASETTNETRRCRDAEDCRHPGDALRALTDIIAQKLTNGLGR